MDDTDDSDDQGEYEPPRKKYKSNKARRLSGIIETTANGLLSFPSQEWVKLTDEEKTFIQSYNSRVKHNEPIDDIQIPKGVTIKNKSRRIPQKFTDPTKVDSNSTKKDSGTQSSDALKSKLKSASKRTHERKKIRFDIEGNNEEPDSDEERNDDNTERQS